MRRFLFWTGFRLRSWKSTSSAPGGLRGLLGATGEMVGCKKGGLIGFKKLGPSQQRSALSVAVLESTDRICSRIEENEYKDKISKIQSSKN